MKLLTELNACRYCKTLIPHEPRPVVQLHPASRLIIIGQAPGRKVHESGIPWNDASGKKLREWLAVSDEEFYDAGNFSIVPMSFCYPGKGSSGDLPPLPACAGLWHEKIFTTLNNSPLVMKLLIGQYAQKHYLGKRWSGSLTETVRRAESFLPEFFPLPHPSPRNQNWLNVNPWFKNDVLPVLRLKVRSALDNK